MRLATIYKNEVVRGEQEPRLISLASTHLKYIYVHKLLLMIIMP